MKVTINYFGDFDAKIKWVSKKGFSKIFVGRKINATVGNIPLALP